MREFDPAMIAYGLAINAMWVAAALIGLRILSDMFERWRRSLLTDERLCELERAEKSLTDRLLELDYLRNDVTTLQCEQNSTRSDVDKIAPLYEQVQQHGRRLQEVVELRQRAEELSKTVADARTRLGRIELGEGLAPERPWRG